MPSNYEIHIAEQKKYESILVSAMDILDEVKDYTIMKDGHYKLMCDAFLELSKTKIYHEIVKRVNRNKPINQRIALDEKRDNPDYIFCEKCSRYIKKLSKYTNLKSHQKLDICINTLQIKQSSVVCGKQTIKNGIVIPPKYIEKCQILNQKLQKRMYIPNTDIEKPQKYQYWQTLTNNGSNTIRHIINRKYPLWNNENNNEIGKSFYEIMANTVEIKTIKIKRRKIVKREIILEH